MTDRERTQLTMRHLERAYTTSTKTGTKGRRDNEVERLILDAISVLQRINPEVVITI